MERTVKSMIKRFASLLLAIATLASVVPTALANPAEYFSDFPTGWSKLAMEAAVDNGLLMGIGGDQIGPQKNLTRAEMAAVMVRAFGATTMADVSDFTDLDENSWYYDSVASAVKMGALAGISDTEMAPNDYITREQVFSVLARILALNSSNTQVLSKFRDRANISSWARSTVIPMVERGYVNGDDLGNINPKAYITREEFAQVMYTTIKKYITEPGTYEDDMDGIVVFRTGDITLKGVTVSGDLVVGDGAAKDLVILDDVLVDGRLLTRGGTIELKETKVDDGVVVLNPNGKTRFNNYRIEKPFEDIIEHTEAQFLTPVSGGPSGSVGERITVNFYDGYGTLEENKIGSTVILTLDNGVAKVPSDIIPDIRTAWDGDGFKASKYMPSDYDSLTNEYKVAPSFWYQDAGEWKIFDENVVLNQNTNVFLMYRNVSLSVPNVGIYARYDEDARFMDTAKVLAHQTYTMLEQAKNGNPMYKKLYDSLNANIKDIFNGIGYVFEKNDKQYISSYPFQLNLSYALDEDDVQRVINDRIGNLKKYITNPGSVETLLKWPGVDAYLVEKGISASDTSAIISHVSGLTDVSGIKNKIYATPEYSGVIDAINNNSVFTVIPTNLELLKAIREELQEITFDTVMDMSDSPIKGMVSILGKPVCADIFYGGRKVYCDELVTLIGDVESGTDTSKEILTAFTLEFDIVGDILTPLYEIAEKKMDDKINASVHYKDNEYLNYLVGLNTINEMFGQDSTGYYIKDITDYAHYMVRLLIAMDDALCWYGDLADAETVYNEVIEDIYDVHGRLDEILKDFYNEGTLPGVLQTALDSVQQLQSIFGQIKAPLKELIGAYFNTTIYDDLSNRTLARNANFVKLAEILAGKEAETFTVDSFYEALGNNEAAIQSFLGGISPNSISKIRELLEYTLGIRADVVGGIVGIIETIRDKGFREYHIKNPAGATTIDVYKVPFGGNEISIKRSLEK